MKETILAALAKLDPAVDTHWTAEGLVNLNSFKFIAGGVAVTREQLEEVAPNFTRANPHVEVKQAPTDTSNGTDPALEDGSEEPTSQVEFNVDSLTPVEELSDEVLASVVEDHLDIIDDLNISREKFNRHIDEKIKYLRAAKVEQERRVPQMSLADMVRRAHELNANSASPASMPRARAHVAYPLIGKK